MNEILETFLILMREKSLVSYTIILAYGLLIGSFLNVIIYRLPIMMNIEYIKSIRDVTNLPDEVLTKEMTDLEKKEYFEMMEMKDMNLSFPRSRCGSCGCNIEIWNNIPIISYLILRGKCKYCKKSYSPRYLIVEALIGAISCFSFYTFGATPEFLIITTVVIALIASLFIDIEHKLLPDQITILSIFGGLLFNIISDERFTSSTSSILGVIIGYAVVSLIVKGYEKIRKAGVMMGDGDLKLYAMCGAWVGLYNLPFLIVMSTVLGILQFALIAPFVKDIKNHQLPFGPAIIISLFSFIFFNNEIVNFISSIGFN